MKRAFANFDTLTYIIAPHLTMMVRDYPGGGGGTSFNPLLTSQAVIVSW